MSSLQTPTSTSNSIQILSKDSQNQLNCDDNCVEMPTLVPELPMIISNENDDVTTLPPLPPLICSISTADVSVGHLNPPILSPALERDDKNQHFQLNNHKGDIDLIEGIEFHSFETEDELKNFAEIDENKRKKNSIDEKINNFANKLIKIPKYTISDTQDISKLKGWRRKLFALDHVNENDLIKSSSPFYDETNFTNNFPSFSCNMHGLKSSTTNCTSTIASSSIASSTLASLASIAVANNHSLNNNNSAFYSDSLESYLNKNKSIFNFCHLNPGTIPPPEDSPIFSAGALKIPDNSTSTIVNNNNNSSNFILLPSHSSKTKSPKVRKKSSKKYKRIKSKPTASSTITSIKSSKNQIPNQLIFQDDYSVEYFGDLPLIKKTYWFQHIDQDIDDKEGFLEEIYYKYVQESLEYMQMFQTVPQLSLVMDDDYSRFASSAVQIRNQINTSSSSSSHCEEINDGKQKIDVLSAVGLTRNKNESKTTVNQKQETQNLEESKMSEQKRKRNRNNQGMDIAKIIGGSNRSKREIRLPSRYHETSLLMGNQWVIPDYEVKGKRGKRRLQQEQKRLFSLQQKQFQLEQRNNHSQNNNTSLMSIFTDKMPKKSVKQRKQNGMSLLQPNHLKSVQWPSIKPKSNTSPIKIPNYNPRKIQTMFGSKNEPQFSRFNSNSKKGNKKSMKFRTKMNKLLDAAKDRRRARELLCQLYCIVKPDRKAITTKIVKRQVLDEAIEMIEKLKKRDQQLTYIKKLLMLWNNKLKVCAKVIERGKIDC